jgi:oligoribonuclease NrnB/cAMP/cGMP phosphodiesterase (DHH superfamily)
MSNTKIIYHKINQNTNCPDGYSAAWIALKKYPDAEIIGWEYQTEPPLTSDKLTNLFKLLVRSFSKNVKHPQKTLITPGDRIVIVDFSFPKEVLDSWVAIGVEVIVIDHHKTAQKMLEGFAGGILRFDMEKCGAMLTWEYFFPDKPVPEFIKYVQDQDLWQWSLRYSKEVREAFGSLGRNFKTFNFLETLSGDEFVEYMLSIGEPLVKAREEKVKAIASRHKDTFLDEYIIKAVELTEDELPLTSDVCAFLYNQFPDVPFTACYNYEPQNLLQKLLRKTKTVKWSLRSSNKNPNAVDVSAVAKKRGGGGHHSAAGFSTKEEK